MKLDDFLKTVDFIKEQQVECTAKSCVNIQEEAYKFIKSDNFYPLIYNAYIYAKNNLNWHHLYDSLVILKNGGNDMYFNYSFDSIQKMMNACDQTFINALQTIEEYGNNEYNPYLMYYASIFDSGFKVTINPYMKNVEISFCIEDQSTFVKTAFTMIY